MRICVVGCGNAGSAVAADLSLKGHDVIILKTSRALHNEHFEVVKKNGRIDLLENDVVKTAFVKATEDFSEAIAGRQLIIVFIQTNYHEQLIKRMSQYLEDDQIVLLEPGYLSTCYLINSCTKNLKIVEAESSPIDCRIVEPGKVRVLFKNVRNPIGVFPHNESENVFSILGQLQYSFVLTSSVIEAALHNPNLIVHTVGALCSIPRIEYAREHGLPYSMYREVFTPLVWNLVQKLDDEKMNVLSALDCKRIPYVEACKFRNSLENGQDATKVFFEYAQNSAPDGPNEPDSRYVTEDVPQGLILLESLGNVLNVPTPVCTSLIQIASAMLERNFRAEGRTVEKLGIDTIKKIMADCFD